MRLTFVQNSQANTKLNECSVHYDDAAQKIAVVVAHILMYFIYIDMCIVDEFFSRFDREKRVVRPYMHTDRAIH